MGDGRCLCVLCVLLLTPTPTQAQSPKTFQPNSIIGQEEDHGVFFLIKKWLTQFLLLRRG